MTLYLYTRFLPKHEKMGRYYYNPMRYNFDNVPMNIVFDTPAGYARPAETPSVLPNYNQQSSAGEGEQFSLRSGEYQEIAKSYEHWQKTFAMQKATMGFLHGDSQCASYVTEYGKKLNNFGAYIDKLTPEEYAKSFKELTGMSVDEYRAKKAENPQFRFNFADVVETKRKKAHINITEDGVDYGKKTVKNCAESAVEAKTRNLSSARKQLYDVKENAWNRDLNDICDFLNVGTTRGGAKKEFYNQDVQISGMRKAIEAGDMEDFAVRFEEYTGREFRIENFVKLQDAREKYNSAPEGSKEKEQLQAEYVQAIKNAYGDNVSQETFDSYMTTKKVSEGISKGALIVGATIATGGIAGAVGGAAASGTMALGATSTTAAVVGGAASAAVTTAAASGASAAYDHIANKTGDAEDQVDTGRNAAEIAAYTTEAHLAAGAGKFASKCIPGPWGKVAGIALEIGADASASYGIAKGFGHDTTIAQEGTIATASSLIPRLGALGAGAKNARTTSKAVNQQVTMNFEGVDKKFVDIIKRERPYLSDEMTIKHAKRLQRVSEGKTPWEEGPVSDYDKERHFRFYSEDPNGLRDLESQMKKIVRPGDKLMPVQKMELTEHEKELIDVYYREGTSHLSEDDMMDLCDIVRRSKPLDQDYTVYRTVNAGRNSSYVNSAFIDELKEGTVITKRDWTSTATKNDWACLQFHPDSLMGGGSGKGYVMRINLPKGTKGIDVRAAGVRKGFQSEFMLPPNSQIKVNKIDHVNQIIECEYILPKTEDYMPNSAFDMKLSHLGKYDKHSIGDIDDVFTETSTLSYPNRKIEHVEVYKDSAVPEIDIKTDVITRPDGSTVTVKTDWSSGKRVLEKVIRNKDGKVIFKDTIKP